MMEGRSLYKKNVSGSSLNASERESNCCKLHFLVLDEAWRRKPTSSLSTVPGITPLTEGHCVSVQLNVAAAEVKSSRGSSVVPQCVHTLPSRAFRSSRAAGTNAHVVLPCGDVRQLTGGKWRLHTSCRVLMSAAGSLFFFAEPTCFPHIISFYMCLHSPSLFKWVVKYLWGKCYEVVEKLSLREVTDQSRRRQASGAHVYPALISLF